MNLRKKLSIFLIGLSLCLGTYYFLSRKPVIFLSKPITPGLDTVISVHDFKRAAVSAEEFYPILKNRLDGQVYFMKRVDEGPSYLRIWFSPDRHSPKVHNYFVTLALDPIQVKIVTQYIYDHAKLDGFGIQLAPKEKFIAHFSCENCERFKDYDEELEQDPYEFQVNISFPGSVTFRGQELDKIYPPTTSP